MKLINSRWWGKPVGIVDDPEFFSLEKHEAGALLKSFDWVEFRMRLGPNVAYDRIHSAGFFQVDTQLPFSLNLKQLEGTISTDSLEAVSAIDNPFRVRGEQLASQQQL